MNSKNNPLYPLPGEHEANAHLVNWEANNQGRETLTKKHPSNRSRSKENVKETV